MTELNQNVRLLMSNRIYKCKFKYKGLEHTASAETLDMFTQGFWINPEFQRTAGHDAAVWIPPHKIEYVYKEYED